MKENKEKNEEGKQLEEIEARSTKEMIGKKWELIVEKNLIKRRKNQRKGKIMKEIKREPMKGK